MSFDFESFKRGYLKELPWTVAIIVLTLLYTWLFIKATGVAIIVMFSLIITIWLYTMRILARMETTFIATIE